MNDRDIEFVGVHRHFGHSEVLRGLQFEVRAGEIYGLLGRNGSGKTTALRILLGLLDPHAGTTSIGGLPSQQLTPADRSRIAYVGEDHRLYPTFRVTDAIEFEAGTRRSFRRELVERAADRCGLPRTRRVFQLSRGQRAQLALLLAIGAEPQILIFDDPSLGLDPVMRHELLDALIDLLAEVGCTVLLTSHQLHDVERIADRVGILHDGRLIVDATIDDLKRRVVCRRWSPPSAVRGRPFPEWPHAPLTGATRSGVLAVRRVGAEFELTLLDPNNALDRLLTATGGTLGPARTPSLEDLFRELTTEVSGGLALFGDSADPTTVEQFA